MGACTGIDVCRRCQLAWPVCLAIALLGCGDAGPLARPPARFVHEVPWSRSGRWMKIDTHVHTEFSDGAHTIQEVVAQAERFGCDAVAITDHCDRLSESRIPEYVRAIDVARREFPAMVILTGVEWNVPPSGGDDHATVLFPPGTDEMDVITTFIDRFDDYGRTEHDPQLTLEALRWLERLPSPEGAAAVVMMNHPCRNKNSSTELIAPIETWLGAGNVFIGFSGAPGHQAGKVVGAYDGPEKLVDRWDPATARVGDVWDTLLRQNVVHAARAASDFHSRQGHSASDFWPGEFSETWVLVPERTRAGLLKGLRAGTFFANHGGICREVQLLVRAEGLPREARAGEIIEVPAGTSVEVLIDCQVPERDLQGRINWIDSIELIAITEAGAEVVAESPPLRSQGNRLWYGGVPDSGLVLRARGYRLEPDGTKLMFYTNSVRVVSRL